MVVERCDSLEGAVIEDAGGCMTVSSCTSCLRMMPLARRQLVVNVISADCGELTGTTDDPDDIVSACTFQTRIYVTYCVYKQAKMLIRCRHDMRLSA